MTKRRIRGTRQLREDLIEIYGYIHERSPRSAERVFDAIEASIRALRDRPALGRRWDSPDPRLEGMRVLVVTRYPNYLVFFRVVGRRDVEVFRVLHGARELQRLIDEIELDFEDEST